MMKYSRPKTIKIFLVDGEPDGLRIVELSNWIGQALVIPRNKLKDVKDRNEFNKPSVYFLIAKDPENVSIPTIYVGEAENLWNRLASHDDKKDFWQMVIAFVSKDSNLTKAHVKFLESRCLSIANDTKRSVIKNESDSTLPNLSEADRAEMEEFLENLQILISALGYPIMQKTIQKEDAPSDSPLFVCAGKGVSATGRLINDGFIVYKGSTASIERSKTAIDRDSHKRLIEKLLEMKYICKEGTVFRFTNDYIFNSPTAAAEIILGHPASGWERWKMDKDKTLKEFYDIK